MHSSIQHMISMVAPPVSNHRSIVVQCKELALNKFLCFISCEKVEKNCSLTPHPHLSLFFCTPKTLFQHILFMGNPFDTLPQKPRDAVVLKVTSQLGSTVPNDL